MTFGDYVLTGIFIILLVMYIVKTRIDRQFRKKVVPILKKQKSDIDKLENDLSDRKNTTSEQEREIIKLNEKITGQNVEYSKIEYILSKGLFEPLEIILRSSKKYKTPDKKDKSDPVKKVNPEDLAHQSLVIEWWFKKAYVNPDTELEIIEITDVLKLLCDQLNKEFNNKHLTFINHISEPISVSSQREIVKYIILTFGRLLGHRTASGSTLYLDTEKTGKKCLISLEDAGPGSEDHNIKSLFTETWMPDKLPEISDEQILPVILSKELINELQGNVWIGKVQEIGMKITFSIPLGG